MSWGWEIDEPWKAYEVWEIENQPSDDEDEEPDNGSEEE